MQNLTLRVRRRIRLTVTALCTSMVLSLAACGQTQPNQTPSNVNSPISNIFGSSEKETRVTDFYTEANADWLRENALTQYEYFNAAMTDQTFVMYDKLIALLEGIDPTTLSESDPLCKIVTFYRQICDEQAKETVNMDQIRSYIDRFESIQSTDEFIEVMCDETYFHLNPLFQVTYEESGQGFYMLQIAPEPLFGFYFPLESEEQAIVREQLVQGFRLLGYSDSQAVSMVDNALRLNSIILEYYATLVSQESPYLAQTVLDEKKVTFPYIRILESHGVKYPKTLYHDGTTGFYTEDAFLKLIDTLFTEQNVPMFRDLCAVDTMCYLCHFGSKDLSVTISGIMDRLSGIDNKDASAIDEAYRKNLKYQNVALLTRYDQSYLANYYLQNCVTAHEKELVDAYVAESKKTLSELLGQIDWLDNRSRERLIVKAKKIRVLSGTYEIYNPLDDIEIGGNAVQTSMNWVLSNKAFDREQFLGQKEVLLPDVNLFATNAYYLPKNNAFVLCLGLFSDAEKLEEQTREAWYGSFGTIINHEMAHAFDYAGIERRSDGLYEELFSDEQYEKYYETYYAIESLLKGRKTQSGYDILYAQVGNETYVDLLGMKCSLDQLKKLENPDYDAFFRSYAGMYATVMTPAYEWLSVRSDTHMPNHERINLVLAQFDEFYETYDVKKSSPFYIKKNDRIRVFSIE